MRAPRLSVLLLAAMAIVQSADSGGGAARLHGRVPPEEFAAHRTALLDCVGDAVVVLQGATELPSYQRFRQSNAFFDLTGVEVPRALLLLDGRTRQATLFLAPRQPAIERMEGPGTRPRGRGRRPVLARPARVWTARTCGSTRR